MEQPTSCCLLNEHQANHKHANHFCRVIRHSIYFVSITVNTEISLFFYYGWIAILQWSMMSFYKFKIYTFSMRRTQTNNFNLPVLCRILSSLIHIILTGATSFAAYQAGYLVLPICLIALLSSMIILKSLFGSEITITKNHFMALDALTYFTSALLQNSIFLLLTSAVMLLAAATVPIKEESFTNLFTLTCIIILEYFINNLVYGHILTSVFSLVGIEKAAIIVFQILLQALAQTQQPVQSPTNVRPSQYHSKSSSTFFSFSQPSHSCTIQVNFDTEPAAEEQCSIM